MSGMSGMALDALADASLRAALVAALVAAALAALRVRAGATRHAAWTIVLVAMLLMPALPRLVPAVGVPLPHAARDAVAAAGVPTHVTRWLMGFPGRLRREPDARRDQRERRHRFAPRVGRNPATAPPPLTAPSRERGVSRDPAPATPSLGESSWAATALAVYVAGLAPMLLRLVLGLWGSRRLARGARPIDGPARRRLGAVPVRVRESDRVAVPVTVGLLRPVVVLPPGWERWPDARLRAVLAHERAHVARRDPLVAGLASLNRCLFWFHPVAWWLQRTLALTAEQACDETAVRTVGAPQAYIDVLRSMAVAVRARGGRYSWEGVGMHGSPSLTRRIAHIRRLAPPRAATPFSRTALGACCCLIAVAVAACRPALDGTVDRFPDIQRQIDTATVAGWPVERLIDQFPDTEVAVPQGDRPRAEEILLERRTADPTGPWSTRLGRFYAASATGYRVRITDDGPLVEVTDYDPDSAFATHARARLAESSDPVLLVAAADYVLHAPRYNRNAFPEDLRLAKDCLERAAGLDPESARTRTMLADLVASERSRAARQRVCDLAPVEQYDALAALPPAERFEAMAEAAVHALQAFRGAARHDDRNLAGYIAVKRDNARRFASEVLALAPRFAGMPDAGLFIYRAHMTLASLAMREGDVDTAVDALRRASLAPPAEGLTYGHRVAAWRVLLDLVDAGERIAVVDFLEAMAERNLADRDRLLATADDVRDGRSPSRLFRRANPADRG